MLGLRFQLTPAQVDMLLSATYGAVIASTYTNKRGEEKTSVFLPYESSYFVPTGQSLQRKGLLDHNGSHWLVTDEGRAIASIIAKKAREIVDIVDSSEPGKRYADVVDKLHREELAAQQAAD